MSTRPNDPGELLALAADGDRVALARVLSLVERGGAASQAVARLSYRGPIPYTLGITGAPGAGKSTLVDQLIAFGRAGFVSEHGEPEGADQLAVLAVDPSSPFSGGAILGDRVRMGRHATDPDVFIRSMATRGHLGGLALAVPDAVRVLGAARFPIVLIETVGVGQMEVEIASAADTTAVVVTPGWGDSMQANKAGLLEVADLFVINKADRAGVREARRDLEQMLDLSMTGDWRPPIIETTSTTGEGVDTLWAEVSRHRSFLIDKGLLEPVRALRLEAELRKVLSARLLVTIEEVASQQSFADAVHALVAGTIDPYEAAERLLGSARG